MVVEKKTINEIIKKVTNIFTQVDSYYYAIEKITELITAKVYSNDNN